MKTLLELNQKLVQLPLNELLREIEFDDAWSWVYSWNLFDYDDIWNIFKTIALIF